MQSRLTSRAQPSGDLAGRTFSRERAAGAFADLALELHSTRAHFTGTPTWLEGLEIEARVVRHRTGPVERATSIRLRTRAA